MSILPYLSLNCELTAGACPLRLLLLCLLLLEWAAYQQTYAQDWGENAPLENSSFLAAEAAHAGGV